MMKKLEELGISPAPWYRKGYENSKMHFGGNIHSGKVRICGCNFLCDEGEANANLIAAAPELYEALKCFVDRYDTSKKTTIFVLEKVMEKARKALAKAAGEEGSDD